jgi:hypothetical protein
LPACYAFASAAAVNPGKVPEFAAEFLVRFERAPGVASGNPGERSTGSAAFIGDELRLARM